MVVCPLASSRGACLHACAQDLMKHVSDLKEGKESMKNEVFLALRNNGEDEAKELCEAVLHPVKIWHGRCGAVRCGWTVPGSQSAVVRCAVRLVGILLF